MENILKTISVLMLTALITIQILLSTSYRERLTDDALNGRTIKTYETLVYKGTIRLDALGKYEPNSATVLINGESGKTIDSFPLEVTLNDGDVLEIGLKPGSTPFYVYFSGKKGSITTDLRGSTVLVNHGINRILKARVLAPK